MGWVVSSTPRPHFTPGKDPVPIVQEAGWAPGPLRTCAENFAPPPGFDPWTVQSVASRYTDWATPARSPIGSQNCEPCYSKFFVKETVVKLQLHVKRRLSVRYRTRVRLSDVYVRPFTFMSDPSRLCQTLHVYVRPFTFMSDPSRLCQTLHVGTEWNLNILKWFWRRSILMEKQTFPLHYVITLCSSCTERIKQTMNIRCIHICLRVQLTLLDSRNF